MPPLSFDERLALKFDAMSPTEQRVVRVLREGREDILVASAASLAEKAGTSDATVVRTVKALGFSGMDQLRRDLADELKKDRNIADRMSETLRTIGDDLELAFTRTLDIHREALEQQRREISVSTFRKTVEAIAGANRVVLFGIGPTSAIVSYLATQLERFGIETLCLVHTGILFADELHKLRKGDLLIALAYGHVYRELDVLLNEADGHRIKIILITDSLAAALNQRVNTVLPVARGRTDHLSMHTATLGLIEALLVGVAVKCPKDTVRSLAELNALRSEIIGEADSVPGGPKKGRVRRRGKMRRA